MRLGIVCVAGALLAGSAGAAVTVSVSPSAVDLRLGAVKKFTATVTGTTDKTVAWFVNSTPGGSAELGTIAPDGTYTAPATRPPANSIQVIAKNPPGSTTPVVDNAVVTLLNPVAQMTAVEPSSVNIGAFSLKITGKGFLPASKVMFGTTALQVTFVSATELTAKGSSDAAGQTFAVKVINPDPGGSTSNEKSVKVLASITVTVSPATRKMRAGETYDFSSSVANSSNKTVAWAVNGVVSGNAQLGTVDEQGIYNAPAQVPPGTMTADGVAVTLTATSAANSTAVGTATVFVRNPIPQITTATPASLAPGPFALSIQGTGFAPGAIVRLGSAVLSVASVTPTMISATGTAFPTPTGIAPLQVENPDPGTAKSNVIALPVTVSGVISKAAAARFLELATWGPTPDLLARLQKEGTTSYLNEQLAMPTVSVYADAIPDPSSLTPMRRRFFINAVNQPDQLRQRVAFALSQIFVVSANTVGNDYQMIPYQRMLLAKAFDNYYDVLRAVTLSPTMGRYLDMVNNAKADVKKGTAPNENYAREVLQLLSIGLFKLNPDGSQQRDSNGATIAPYDQAVITDLARVFTGWTYPTRPGATQVARNPSYYEGPMEPWEASHDTGAKTLMDGYQIPPGRTATEDLDLALHHIFDHPNIGPFVSVRLIRQLVMSNPSPAYVGRVAAVFNNNGSGVRGDLKAVVRAILTDPDAQSSTGTGGHLREPVLYEVSLARALGATVAEENSFNSYATSMAQNLFQAPSVFNYYSPGYRIQSGAFFGPEFQIYTPSNAMNRANFVYRLVRSSVGGVAVNLDDFIALAANPDTLLNAVDNALYQGRMPDYVRQAIRPALDATKDQRTRARNALYVAALAGDYLIIH